MTTEPCPASLVKLVKHDDINNPIVDYKGTSYIVGIGTDKPVNVCRFRNDRHDNGKKSCIGKGMPSVGYFNCRNSKCEKSVHIECYFNFIDREDDGHVGDNGMVLLVCSKRCYNAVKKDVAKGNAANLHWANDGGEKMSSEQLLIEWLKDERRCSKLLGAEDSSTSDKQFGGNDGLTKSAIYLEISLFIKSRNGVHRPPRGVENKVNALMASYKKTKDWINNTGQGVLLEDGEVSFRELVMKKFPYFYDLDPVLCQRPSIDSYTNDGSYSDTASDSEASDSESGERKQTSRPFTPISEIASVEGEKKRAKLTSRSFTPVSELGSVEGEKIHASNRYEKVKEVKKKIHKDRSATVVNFGVSDETKDYIRLKTATTLKKMKLAEEASKVRNQEFEINRHALEATSRLQVAKANMEMMELRQKFQAQNPSCTQDELESMFPLSEMPSFGN